MVVSHIIIGLFSYLSLEVTEYLLADIYRPFLIVSINIYILDQVYVVI